MKKVQDILCPVCYESNGVKSDSSSSFGESGNGHSDGETKSIFYCVNCFTDFTIVTTYHKHKFNKYENIIGETGITG